MSLIDQRILIAASTETIWPFLTDAPLITRWNRAYKQVSILSTKATGVNSRRRCVGENGKAVVEEATAWLENIGYEYVVIDGPYQRFRGRFRLQAIPEGTVVSWTVDYALKGPFGGLINFLSTRRRMDGMMGESLKTLRRLVENSGVRLSPTQHERYAMRSGPSMEERTAHLLIQAPVAGPGPRDPSVSRGMEMVDDDIPELPNAVVPAASQANQPAGVIKPDTGSFVPSFAAEPNETTPTPAADPHDTRPRAPQGLREAIASQMQTGTHPKPEPKPAIIEEPLEDSEPLQIGSTVPTSLVAPPAEPIKLIDTQTMNVVPQQTPPPMPVFPKAPETLPERIPTAPMPPVVDPDPTPQPGDSSKREGFRDTKDMSIWDVFGMVPPSERNQAELSALIQDIQRRATDPDAPEAQATEPVLPAEQQAGEAAGVRQYLAGLFAPPSAKATRRTPPRRATAPVRVANHRARRAKTKAPVRSARM